jgi:hypothetical protein
MLVLLLVVLLVGDLLVRRNIDMNIFKVVKELIHFKNLQVIMLLELVIFNNQEELINMFNLLDPVEDIQLLQLKNLKEDLKQHLIHI